MGTTTDTGDLADEDPTNRDAAAVIAPSGGHSIGPTPPSAAAAIGPNRHRRDWGKPAPRRTRRLDRVHTLRPVAARSIVAAAAIGLTALSVAFAAPAAAHGSHGGGGIRHHHTATNAVHEQAVRANRVTSPSSSTKNAAVDPPASNPATGSMPQVGPGHDKCKSQKAGRPGPPWCTDPSAGWMQSTLHRTDASYPTLPGAQAAAETGRAAAHRGAVQRPVPRG